MVLPSGVSPLNGLTVDDPTLLDRRVVGVKVDNAPAAQPQSGLQDADAVIEILVEADATRFIALFHASDSELVGPIRSLRPSDLPIASVLGATLAISGGQQWVLQMAAGHEVDLITEDQGLMRVATRPSPHNLYTTTEDLRDIADDLVYSDDPPVAWLPFGEWPLPTAPAETVTITWAVGAAVQWRYDTATRTYLRWTGPDPNTWIDEEGEIGQIDTDVLIVFGARFYVANPPTGVQATPVPAVDSVGSGPAWVFSQGRAWLGTWQRDFPTDPFTLIGNDGQTATVPGGRIWMSVLPEAQHVVFG